MVSSHRRVRPPAPRDRRQADLIAGCRQVGWQYQHHSQIFAVMLAYICTML